MRLLLTRTLAVLAATISVALVAEGLLCAGLLGNAGLVPELVTREHLKEANWHQAAKDFTWHGQVGRPREFSVASKWNSLGFNDDDYPLEKAPGTARILVLGDLFVEAVQVPRDASFHNLLETRLRASASSPRVEVIALGRSGSGPRLSLEILRKTGLRYQPDVVVMEFYGLNDVSDDSEALAVAFAEQARRLKAISSRPGLPEPWPGESSWAARLGLGRSRLAVALGQAWNDAAYARRVSTLAPVDRIPHHWFAFSEQLDAGDPYGKAWTEGWENTLGYIREAQEACADAGARLLLVRFPDRWRTEPKGLEELQETWPALASMKMDYEKDARLLEAFTSEQGIAYLDLFPDFRSGWRKDVPLHFPADSHWTEAGHALAATAIEKKLRDLGWLP